MLGLFSRAVFGTALFCGLAAAQQFYSTPYDLIRPVWPLTWDPTVFDLYVGNPTKTDPVPSNRTPADFTPNGLVPDTLNQAYLDAMNLQIGRIRINQAGYLTEDLVRQFYYVGDATDYVVVDSTGKEVGKGEFASSGKTTTSSWKIVAATDAASADQERYTAATTGPTGDLKIGNLPTTLPVEQRLRVKVGDDYSATFIISDRVYSMVRDATLKFMGINRSGNSQSWFHKPSHLKDGMGPLATFYKTTASGVTSQEGALSGGWYDCGDHLKESLTQGYALMTLAVLAASNPGKDEDHYAFNHEDASNMDGVPDMLREAVHGAEFALKSYDFASGVIDNMPLSVGNYGSDHGWWGRPETQDEIPSSITGRGGPYERDVRLGELGSTASAEFAAGLAIVSRLYAPYNAEFSAKCLKVAEELYDFAKNRMLGKATYGNGKTFVHNQQAAAWGTPAYGGNNEAYDDLAVAAVSLLYATKNAKYLDDAAENKNLLVTEWGTGAGFFNGGWFVTNDKGFLKNTKNTSWANCYTFALYGFYKMILQTDSSAAAYNITPTKRLEYIEDILYNMTANLGDNGMGTGGGLVLPQGDAGWKNTVVMHDPLWYFQHTDSDWIWNRYQAGNIFDVLAYADVAKDVENVALPVKGAKDWRSDDMRNLGLRQMDYLLGVNPWDVSFLLGVGDKNDAHPHHRAANPEGKNVPGSAYIYRPPTGALFGGVPPSADNSWAPSNKSWEDYFKSETCIDATVTFISCGTMAAPAVDLNKAPTVDAVQIKYVGYDTAIVVVRQSIWGTSSIQYGEKEGELTQVVSSDSNAASHTIIIAGLKNGTAYYFTVTATNGHSGNIGEPKYLVDSTKTPYSFTTLTSRPAPADIQNVKVCNVSADSAEIMWYTPNGEYQSKVYYDTVLTNPEDMYGVVDGDESGFPTKFHYVKIGGLKEQTTYYFAVESNGVIRNVDEDGAPLKFTTPVTQYNFSVRAYNYVVDNKDAIGVNIYNNEELAFDSLTLRLYMNGTEEQMTKCAFMANMQICQAYNEAGFNLPCENWNTELNPLLRSAEPVKLDDTYDNVTGRYAWYYPIPLGSTTIKSSSRLRFDLAFVKGLSQPGQTECMYGAEGSYPSKHPSAADGDWSYRAHSIADDDGSLVDYDGMPSENKNYGDAQLAPVDPYITVYRKDQFVWGNSPSAKEQATKRADYKLTVGFDAPFNVTDGSYLEIDQGTSTVYATGNAVITEGGEITQIWVNGVQLSSLEGVVTYNATTKRFDLKIPVKMGIGGNEIDITIFAGPDADCEECQENGGCAFLNRSFYVQFSKGNRTKSSLTLQKEDGSPVTSPAVPGSTQFFILVTDKDNAKAGSVIAYVINARKQDTLKVTLAEGTEGSFKSALINAVNKDAGSTTGNEISFFGGDTLVVRYVDAEDEEDISEQTIYADPTYPVPLFAAALDKNCDGKTDHLNVVFSTTFGPNDKFDTMWVSLQNPTTLEADSFKVAVTQPVVNLNSITVALPARTTIPTTSAPTGYVAAYLKSATDPNVQIERTTVRDSIAPTIQGVALLENPPFGEGSREAQDTLKISFSEPVTLANVTSWPLDVLNGTAPVAQTGIKVIGKATTTDNGRSWLYVVEGNTDGALIKNGYTASIRADFKVTDLALNELQPAGCNPTTKIVETPRPVPVSDAQMIDVAGDGNADTLFLRFERKLRDKDMLDSFVVRWGIEGLTRAFVKEQWIATHKLEKNSMGDSVSTIRIPVAKEASRKFPFGATSGPDNGYGSVVPRLGPEGGFFDVSYAVADLCPPVIVEASKDEGSKVPYVTVVLSEPVDSLDGDFYLQRRRDSIEVAHRSAIASDKGKKWVFSYLDEAQGALRIGDWIRLVPNAQAKVQDKSKNKPTDSNPWTELKGAVSEMIRFEVTAVRPVASGLTGQKGGSAYAGNWPTKGEQFRLTVVDPASGREIRLASGASNLSGTERLDLYDTAEYRHMGPTYQIDVIMPLAKTEVAGSKAWDFTVSMKLDLFDNLGQFANSTNYQFTLSDLGVERDLVSSDGTLRFMLEWVAPQKEKSPLSQDNRAVGSGVFISAFDFNGTATYLVDGAGFDAEGNALVAEYERGQRVKVEDEQSLTVGVKRWK